MTTPTPEVRGNKASISFSILLLLLISACTIRAQHFGVWTPRLIGSTEGFWERSIKLSKTPQRVICILPISFSERRRGYSNDPWVYVGKRESIWTVTSRSEGHTGEARGSMFPILEGLERNSPFRFEKVDSIEWEGLLSVMTGASESMVNRKIRGPVRIPDMWAETRHSVVPGLNPAF